MISFGVLLKRKIGDFFKDGGGRVCGLTGEIDESFCKINLNEFLGVLLGSVY